MIQSEKKKQKSHKKSHKRRNKMKKKQKKSKRKKNKKVKSSRSRRNSDTSSDQSTSSSDESTSSYSESESERTGKNDQTTEPMSHEAEEPVNCVLNKMEQKVAYSDEFGDSDKKYNRCLYCGEGFARVDKHVKAKHEDEERVNIIINMPTGLQKRRIYTQLLRDGNDKFANDRVNNPHNIIIPARRIRKKYKLTSNSNEDKENNNDERAKEPDRNILDKNCCQIKEAVQIDTSDLHETFKTKPIYPPFMKCIYCKAYVGSKSLSEHVRRQHPEKRKLALKNVLNEARINMGLCHNTASTLSRENILIDLRPDAVRIAASHDWLIVQFANRQAVKYVEPDQRAYVRSNMRLLGKLLIAVKSVNENIQQLSDAFQATRCQDIIKAIQIISDLDSKKNRFLTIYNAETTPLLIRKCIVILKNLFTMQKGKTESERTKLVKNVEDFERVFNDEIHHNVSYTAALSRKTSNRHKEQVKLPNSDDIGIFSTFLKMKRLASVRHFENGGCELKHYKNLIMCTAAVLLILNRRRVGEISKTGLADYVKARKADVSSDFFQALPKAEQKERVKFKRIDMKGKRFDGQGSIYVPDDDDKCLKKIIELRGKFQIPDTNEYLFALPTDERRADDKHVDLCKTISFLSKECAETYKHINDETLRGTLLRKHLATYAGLVTHGEKNKLVIKHMGHKENVHHSHYRQTVDSQDVAALKVLEAAKSKPQIVGVQNIDEIDDDYSPNISEEKDRVIKPKSEYFK